MGQLLRAKSQFKRFAASKGIEFSHGLPLDRLNNSFTAFEISWLSSKSLGKLARPDGTSASGAQQTNCAQVEFFGF
jgi:hypothetical protein